MAKITIHDIARELDIAPSTVSRALNNHPKISEATKTEVWRVARELGYPAALQNQHNTAALDNTIVMLVPNQESSFLRETVKLIWRELQTQGLRLLLMHSYESYAEEKTLVQEILQLRPRGLVVSLSSESPNAQHFKPLLEAQIPMVFFYRVDYNFPAPRIVIDNYQAAYKATKHLIDNGYRRIAHLAGPPSSSVYAELVEGYKAALADHSLNFRPDFLIYSDLTDDDARECMNRLYGPGTQPNAIFAGSNHAALQALLYLKNNGIRVPAQVGVLSYGYNPASAFFFPSITTIEQPAVEMASAILKCLGPLCEGQKMRPSTQVHSAKLIIRTSTLA